MKKYTWLIIIIVVIILLLILFLNVSKNGKTTEKGGNYLSGKHHIVIDIKDYVQDNYVNTQTPVTNLGYEIGEGVNDFINNKVVKFFNYIGGFFK